MSDKIGVMVCGHGSRDIEAIREFEAVARGIRERLPQYQVESGFLEFAQPIIRDGLDKLHAGKVREILAVPGMLFAAGHAKNDIPSVLATYEAKNPAIPIHYGRDLGIDGKLLAAAGARLREAIEAVGEAAGEGVPLEETMLVVVGRGASDSDANSNVAKVMRMLWEGFGFGWAMVAYSGVGASSCSPTSCSPGCWSSASTITPTRLPPRTRKSSSSRRPISTTTPWCSTPSPRGSRRSLPAKTR